MDQQITCINCPVGCRMTVTLSESGEIQSITGNTCPRGEKYARQECTLPVKTASPVPKHLIPEVRAALHTVRISAPVALGQTVLPDVCGTGVPVIATRPLE